MILGVISDVHANAVALRAVLDELRRRGAERVLCLGDLVGYGPSPNETLSLLREREVACTLGAADERVVFEFLRRDAPREGVGDRTLEWTREQLEADHVAFLRSLPVQRRLHTPAGRLRTFHGTAEDPGARLDLAVDPLHLDRILERHRCRILACGGSHVPYYRAVTKGWAFNPGSVGLSLNGEPGADFAVLRIDPDDVTVELGKADYDVAAVAFDVVAWGLPPVVAEALQHGRMPAKTSAPEEPASSDDGDELLR